MKSAEQILEEPIERERRPTWVVSVGIRGPLVGMGPVRFDVLPITAWKLRDTQICRIFLRGRVLRRP